MFSMQTNAANCWSMFPSSKKGDWSDFSRLPYSQALDLEERVSLRNWAAVRN